MTQEQVVVRRLLATEAAAWRAIRLAALRAAPAAFGQSLEQAEAQPLGEYEKTVAGPFPPFAAIVAGEVVGTAGFYVLAGSKVSHRGVLWGMYVSPSHRRRGIARALISAVIAEARGRVEQIHLQVVATNTAAYRLYRDMGFVAYGVEPRALRVDGRYHDEMLMVRMLDA